MKRIHKVAVLGAGTMGARIAAHLANAGVPSFLLDMVPSGSDAASRNRLATAGIDACRKSKPAAFFEPSLAFLVTAGNFEDDLKRVAEADWIIEAVVEDLEIKRALLTKVDAIRKLEPSSRPIPVACRWRRLPKGFQKIFGVAGLARTFSIRRATCACLRLFLRQLPTSG